MAKLYQRGRFCYVGIRNGKERVQVSTGIEVSESPANLRRAQKFMSLRVSELERGVYVKPVNVSLGELWERYLGYAKAHKRSWKRDVQMFGHLQHFTGTRT